MEQMGFSICCLTCDAEDVVGSPRCKSCIQSHVNARDRLLSDHAESKADRLARELITMISDPSQHTEDSVHGEAMIEYSRLVNQHQGTAQPTTSEDIEARFQEQRRKRPKSLIRDVANNRPTTSRELKPEEREELLTKIAGERPKHTPSWDELLEEVGELLEGE